jgi:hypothetical protein
MTGGENRCAVVVPLHPRHYEYGLTIYNEFPDKEVDLYFVFTTNDDRISFETRLAGIRQPPQSLILTDFTDINVVERTKSFVSIKKLYALKQLHHKYDYISCIDAEVKFLDKTGWYGMMKNVVESKIICAGTTNEHNNIVYMSLTRLISPEYHDKLRELSNNYSTYTWWSNLPVYCCKFAPDFLNWIKFDASGLGRFDYSVFDDMVYNFYCALFHGYKIEVIPGIKNSLEFANSGVIQHADTNITKLYWVNKNAYDQNKAYYEQYHFKIIFHLDRVV